MPASTLFISLLILSALGFICLMLAIALAIKRRRKPMAIAFACTFACCIAVGIFGAMLAAHIAHRAVAFVRQQKAEIDANEAARDARSQAALARLKSFVPPQVLPTVPDDFFTYNGIRNWYRFPLVYPYEIDAVPSLDAGGLERYSGKGDIRNPDSGTNTGVIGDITHLSFDGHYLLLKQRPPTDTPNAAPNWMLLKFDTGEMWSFDNEKDLLAEAARRGFTGETQLKSLSDRFDETP